MKVAPMIERKAIRLMKRRHPRVRLNNDQQSTGNVRISATPKGSQPTGWDLTKRQTNVAWQKFYQSSVTISLCHWMWTEIGENSWRLMKSHQSDRSHWMFELLISQTQTVRDSKSFIWSTHFIHSTTHSSINYRTVRVNMSNHRRW